MGGKLGQRWKATVGKVRCAAVNWIQLSQDNIPLLNFMNMMIDFWIVYKHNRRMRWAGHVAQMGEMRNVYSLLVGKLEGKRPLGRPRHRWIDNIKMDLLEIRLNVVDWIGLAQDRYRWRALVMVMNLRVP
jgi:hypothetical protein